MNRIARGLSLSAWVITLALGLGGLVVNAADSHHHAASDIAGVLLALVSLQVMATIGVLIVRRQPGNAIGWIFSASSMLMACGNFVQGYSQYALASTPAPVPGGDVAAALSASYVMGLTLFVSFVMLLFPDGRVPSRRWRPAAWLAGIALTAVWLGFLFAPGNVSDTPPVANPFGMEGAQYLLAAAIAFPVVIGLGIAACVTRYRSGGRQLRQQLRWFVAAICATAVFFVVSLPIQALTGYGVTDFTMLGLFVLVPASVGVAILRYSLYEIDVIIRKTLIFAWLGVALGVLYLGGIALITWMFRSITGQSSALAVTLSTLAVAAAFQPLRTRIQRVVDHRFYRGRYDADQTLDAFSNRLRQQIDLDALHTEMLTVVTDTVQPSHATLWLRSPER